MCSGVALSLESNLRFASVFEVNSEKWIWLPDHFSLIETGDILAHISLHSVNSCAVQVHKLSA
jgi:hypothetical protein